MSTWTQRRQNARERMARPGDTDELYAARSYAIFRDALDFIAEAVAAGAISEAKAAEMRETARTRVVERDLGRPGADERRDRPGYGLPYPAGSTADEQMAIWRGIR